MKRELTLTDIAEYLPYGLKIQDEDQDIWTIRQLGNVDPCMDGDVGLISDDGCYEYYTYIDDIKPVLRPMSDLCVEITDKDYNDGHPFVPLVELAKIAGIGKVDVLEDECEGTFSVGISQYICDDYAAYDFKWSDDRCSFVLTEEDSNNALEEYGNYRLFDLLHRLKLDFRGQIDAGLAVSVHDLKRNPYEAANN